MSKILVDTIDTRSGTTNLTIGSTNSSTVTFENGAVTGHMYPAFEAYLSSDQSITSGAFVKLNINTEVFDTDNCYDNSTNYRFTPTVAGKYMVYAQLRAEAGTAQYDLGGTFIYKNGTAYASFGFKHQDNNLTSKASPNGNIVIDMNGSSDYLEVYGYVNDSSGNPTVRGTINTYNPTYFGAYRIGS
jgi:hypothetical protein